MQSDKTVIIPVPAVQGPIAVTEDSQPFGAAAHQTEPIDLTCVNYLEEEYFLSGKANVYNWDKPGTAEIRTPNAPYTNRIMVRKPADPKQFSGNVFVEIVNSTSTYDCAVLWYACHEKFLRDGDIYIGMTSKPIAVKSLKKNNPARYAPLSWDNPLPPAQRGSNPGDYMQPGVQGSFTDSEDGLVWDILSQTSVLARSKAEGAPFRQYNVEKVYCLGASQSALVLSTYINAIHPIAKLADGKPVFDGYMLTVGAYPLQINQDAPILFSLGDERTIVRCEVPVIRIMSESDFRTMGPWPFLSTRREDSDLPDDKFRLYEVPGSSHTNYYTIAFRSGREELATIGHEPPDYSDIIPNNFPMYYIFNGALINLDRWAREGIPAPKASRMLIDNDLTEIDPYGNTVPMVKRDQFGNALGGLRTPYLDVPVATYTATILQNPLMGQLFPFTPVHLQQLYGNHDEYVKRFAAKVDEMVKEHWITYSDGERMKVDARYQLAAFKSKK